MIQYVSLMMKEVNKLDRPLVSVIIPAYNSAGYIGQAVESALAQTLTDLEVIVVDDHSSDHTVHVVKQIRDDRLKMYVNEQNVGPSSTRNLGFQAARGKWIAVLDSDDWWEPERLSQLVQAAERNKADVIFDDMYYINETEQTPYATFLAMHDPGIAESGLDTKLSPMHYLDKGYGILQPVFRTEFLRQHHIRYDPDIRNSEDVGIILDCFLKGAKIWIHPWPYYYYRIRSNSISHVSEAFRYVDPLKMINRTLAKVPPDDLDMRLALIRYRKKALLLYRRMRFVHAMKDKKYVEAFLHLHPTIIPQMVSLSFRKVRRRFYEG